MSIDQKQKEGLGKLWRYFDFNKSKMASELGFDRGAVQMWFKRGRISATAAIIVEEKTNKAITKEELRPDVTEWFGL